MHTYIRVSLATRRATRNNFKEALQRGASAGAVAMRSSPFQVPNAFIPLRSFPRRAYIVVLESGHPVDFKYTTGDAQHFAHAFVLLHMRGNQEKYRHGEDP